MSLELNVPARAATPQLDQMLHAGAATEVIFVFDLDVGGAILCSGMFLALLWGRNKPKGPTPQTLTLRNDRQHHGAAMLASGLFTIVGIACFAGLIAAGFRDPAALWAGPEVKSPRAVYLFLEGLALVWSLAMGAFAVFSCRKFMDRAIQLVIDENGLCDHRGDQPAILWSQVADVKVVTQKHKATVTAAALNLVMKNGPTKVIDVFGLDMDHKAILAHTTRMRSALRP
ncbi:MAG: hypothetical protein R3C17_00240 [Planctomycetaceae bacterium]